MCNVKMDKISEIIHVVDATLLGIIYVCSGCREMKKIVELHSEHMVRHPDTGDMFFNLATRYCQECVDQWEQLKHECEPIAEVYDELDDIIGFE